METTPEETDQEKVLREKPLPPPVEVYCESCGVIQDSQMKMSCNCRYMPHLVAFVIFAFIVLGIILVMTGNPK